MTTDAIAYARPWLYPKQAAALFAPGRYAVIEASVKSGKTAGCIVWLLEQAFTGRPGRAYWWVAPVYTQSKIAYRRVKRALPRDLYAANEADLTVTLVNGAALHFKSGEKPDNLYGEDVYAAVIDEACRVKEEAWHAIRSTLTATRGPVRIIGNVHGRANWAYRLARKAQQGAEGYSYAKLTARDAVEGGIIAQDEVDDAERSLPPSVFRELYMAEPSEDGSNPFDLRAIADCVAPLGQGPAVAWGWDLARGEREGADWTVGVALNRERVVCEVQRFQAPWAQQLLRIASCTGTAPALVDATGLGDPVVELLQRQGGSYEAFKFTPQSKQQIMEGLAIRISRREIGFPEGPVRDELDSFEYEHTRTGVRYSAPEGLHDDCVVALALANGHFQGGGPRLRWI